MGAMITLAAKDLLLLLRDKFGLFWVAGFPLVMALMFGSIFGGGSGGAGSMKIAFIGEGNEQSVQGFLAELSKAEVLDILPVFSLDSAREQVMKGRYTAYVHYVDSSDGNIYSMFAGEARPTIQVGIDPSRKAERGYLQGLVNQAYFMRLQQQMTDVSGSRKALSEQLSSLDTADMNTQDRRLLGDLLGSLDHFLSQVQRADSAATADTASGDSSATSAQDFSPFGGTNIEFVDVARKTNHPRSMFEITFPQGIQWALIGCAAAFSLSIVTERTRGTYLRLRLAPIRRWQILGGKGLACFAACLVTLSILMLLGHFIFGVRLGDPWLLLVAILASSFCFVGIMMFVSVIGRTEQAVGGAGWAIFLIMAMAGGGMVPVVMMPSWMLAIGSFSPVKWSVLAIEGAIWRGFAPADMLQPVFILCAVGLVGFIIGTMILARRDR
jgi:ABC-2 type transport system permease protein